ncbi:hypothetical protein M569_10650, partial [Genlisea aurea]
RTSAKRLSETNVRSDRRKKIQVDDDFDDAISSDIKGIMSALQQIKEKTQRDGQKKNEETISSVASEIKSSFDEMKLKLEKERQNFAKGLIKISKECENLMKGEISKFEEIHEKFSKEKNAHVQAVKDVLAKFEEEKGKLFARYEQLRKKEKSVLSEHEKQSAAKIARLEESLKKKKQDDKTFSILRKSLGSLLGNPLDGGGFPLDD